MAIRRFYQHLLALFLYSGLTLVLTYPAIFRLKVAIIGDFVDSFLNTWILAWGVRKITGGAWGSLFDANIFFPYKNTLSYSEHLLGVALTAVPIQLGFNDPLVTFNVSVLITFVLTALSMYFLVWYLTRNGYAAFFSGLLFSFFPWRIGHIAHLQLLSAQWLPAGITGCSWPFSWLFSWSWPCRKEEDSVTGYWGASACFSCSRSW
jgi:hypothetical protein